MAQMHPADLENYSPVYSERKLYEAFQTGLSDKYHVFYSIRWFDRVRDENGEEHRVDSECDFLVFDPSFGFLAIEAKGGVQLLPPEEEGGSWVLEEKDSRSKCVLRTLKRSPYDQAERSMRYFKDYFEEEFQSGYNGVYGFAVALPMYDPPESVAVPRDITIGLGDLQRLEERINELFHYWKNQKNIKNPFSAEQRERFLRLLNKRLALSAAAGALIDVKKREFSRIDFVQDSILEVIYHYRHARIIGGAGTGKTYIAMKKALRVLGEDPAKQVLILSCSQELTDFISGFLKDRLQGRPDGDKRLSRCRVCTYETLLRETLGEQYDTAEQNENGIRSCFDLVDSVRRPRYDAVIVDEGQDFDDDMGLTVRLFLRDEKQSELYVFYDEAQNVYARRFENAFAIDNPPFLLRYNIRNTGSIYRCAVARSGLGAETVANALQGVEPEFRPRNQSCYHKAAQSMRDLDSIVNRLVRQECVLPRSIVLLSNEPYERSWLAGQDRVGPLRLVHDRPLQGIQDGELCFRTVEEFKGLEADVVIYLESVYGGETERDLVERRVEYIALTRARYYLYVLRTRRDLPANPSGEEPDGGGSGAGSERYS